MPPFTLYIVYHKVLYKENTENFSEELLNHLCWAAVNEEIPKEYPSYTENRLIKEWEMKEFSPLYQMSNFYQNSFFHHLYKNQHLIKTKYVGFAQYDQKLVDKDFQELSNVLESDKADKVFGTFIVPFEGCCDHFFIHEWKEIFMDTYNAFYRTNHSIEELKPLPMFLLHTFFIPTWFFNHMMPFIEHITPLIIKKLEWKTRHLAGTLERVYAFCIACGILEGKFRQVAHFKGIVQKDDQRTADEIRGIK